MLTSEVKIRWIDDVDPRNPEPEQVAQVLQRSHSPEGWTASDVRTFMARTDHIPKVLTVDGKVAGCLFYVLHRHVVMLEQFAVDPGYQNQGLETRLLDHLKKSLKVLRRRVVACRVAAQDTAALVYLRSQGFRWVRTLHKETDHELYVMKFTRE